jgi:hypothetical protein
MKTLAMLAGLLLALPAFAQHPSRRSYRLTDAVPAK